MIRQSVSKERQLFLGAISIALLAGAYSYISYRQHVINPKDTTIPSLLEIGKSFGRICTEDEHGQNVTHLLFDSSDSNRIVHFFSEIPQFVDSTRLGKDIIATFERYFAGLGLAAFAAIIFGVAMGCFPKLAAFMVPPLSFLAKIPPTAMLAVFLVNVGTDFWMYVAMISFGVFPSLTQAVYQAAKYDIHDEAVFKAYTLGASNLELITEVVYLQILPKIWESIRLQVGPAMVYLIAAEMLMADVGFGYTLRIQSRIFNMSIVYDYLAILALAGFTMDTACNYARKWFSPWFDMQEED